MVNLNNAHVKITDRDGGWIKLSPFEAQAEPVHLARLKTEISQRWPMISLLDILKEADLRVHFTDHCQTATGYTRLDPAVLQKRLLLCFYGLGTNIGLKRVSAGDHGESYRDLLYTRRRFITRDQLRAATTSVTNAKMLGIVKRKRKSALLAPLGHFPNLNVKLP